MEQYKISEEHEKITGWKTWEESYAYEKGREDEEIVMLKWIKSWDGSVNSGMGSILMKKFNELKNKDVI